MKYLLKTLIAISLYLIVIDTKLYQVVSLSRHGARYHLHYYGNASQTKPMQGQLTATGMRQHQKLGQILRKQYIDGLNFLSPNYSPNQIEVYSTPVNRTVESITSQLYGLYPPGTGPRITFIDNKWHIPPYSNKTNIAEQNFALPNAYQPIKVSFNQKISISDCPNYDGQVKKNIEKKDDDFREMTATYKPFMARLAAMYGFSAENSTIYTFMQLHDVANVDAYLGRPWPKNFTEDDFNNLRHLSNWYFYATLGGNIISMANSGKFQRMLSLFDTRTRVPQTQGVRWTFLSGHDTDVISMYLALELGSAQCTQQLYRKGQTSALNCEQGGNSFASNIIIQLHSNDAAIFYVKVRSNGKYMKLCGKNSETCDYFTFKNLVKKYVVNNIDQLCGKKVEETEIILDSSIKQVTIQ